MIEVTLFIFWNYILVIFTSIVFALIFNWGKEYDKDNIMNGLKAKQETQAITREIIIVNLFLITIARLHFMQLSSTDSLRFLLAGTLGTLLVRTIMTNLVKVGGIVYMTKLKEKIKDDA
jgi:hypothetical protein